MELGEKYDLEVLNNVVGRPMPAGDKDEEDGREAEDDLVRCETEEQGPTQAAEGEGRPVRRRMITTEGVKKFRATPRCRGCEALPKERQEVILHRMGL